MPIAKAFLVLMTISAPFLSVLYGQTVVLTEDPGMQDLQFTLTENRSLNEFEVQLPHPDQTWQTYMAREADFLDADLRASRPDYRSYIVHQPDNPELRGRISVSSLGIDAFVYTPQGPLRIQRRQEANGGDYVVYIRHNPFERHVFEGHNCGMDDYEWLLKDLPQREVISDRSSGGNQFGDVHRSFRLAIVTTGQFYTANGGNMLQAETAVLNTVAAINSIYENELSLSFILLTPYIYTDPYNDPFVSGGNRVHMAASAINAQFPTSTYDIGHVFHNSMAQPVGEMPGGGVAALGVTCWNITPPGWSGPAKAGGWSGAVSNTNNNWIQLVAHEIGHQFNAHHTFNGSGLACSPSNHHAPTAFEIGSGSTIMAYQGICTAPQNIPSQGTADNYFHVNSIQRMQDYILTHAGCSQNTPTNNALPDAQANPCELIATIPVSTPFELHGQAVTIAGTSASYSWEQYDVASGTQGLFGPTAAAHTAAPLFRSYPPSSSPVRSFPSANLLLSNNLNSSFEALPTVARTLNFRYIVRNNMPGAGGIDFDDLAVNVNSAGPFVITYPNGGESIDAFSPLNVQWSVNGTQAFCGTVNILLSVNGGQYFEYVLATGVANNGSANVSLPAGLGDVAQARIRVECATNPCVVFFTISAGNFSIQSQECFHCPQDVVVDASLDQCGALVDLTSFTADSCNQTGVYSIPSGSFFQTGTTEVTYTVTHPSGNTTSCTFLVTVNDTQNPTLNCVNAIDAIAPFNSPSMFVEVTLTAFADNCSGVSVSNSFSNGGANASGIYPVGTTTVVFTATDASGNTASCITVVTVEEESEPVVWIDGEVFKISGEPYPEVTVKLQGDISASTTTAYNGIYFFDNVPANAEVNLEAEVDSDPREGITTQDLILIKQHILGVHSLPTVYHKIAADVNNNGYIEVADLIQLRRLLLYYDNAFVDPYTGVENNRSWRFVMPGIIDPKPSSPEVPAFSEVYTLSGIIENISDANWVAIKVGDVNDLSTPEEMAGMNIGQQRSAMILSVQDLYLTAGQHYSIPLYTADFHSINGLQMQLLLQDGISLNNLESPELKAWGSHHYNVIMQQGNESLLVSWNDAQGWEGAENNLFVMNVYAVQSGYLSNMLTISDQLLTSEAYHSDDGISGIALNFIPADNSGTAGVAGLTLYPVPASQVLNISATTDHAVHAEISIYNVAGQRVYQSTHQSTGQQLEASLPIHQLPAGNYLLRLDDGAESRVQSFTVHR